MPNIVVLVKQVPDTYSERRLTDGDYTLDRDSADAVLDEINERAVEEALLLKEAHRGERRAGARRGGDSQGVVDGGGQGRARVGSGAARGGHRPDGEGAGRRHRPGGGRRPGDRRERGERRRGRRG